MCTSDQPAGEWAAALIGRNRRAVICSQVSELLEPLGCIWLAFPSEESCPHFTEENVLAQPWGAEAPGIKGGPARLTQVLTTTGHKSRFLREGHGWRGSWTKDVSGGQWCKREVFSRVLRCRDISMAPPQPCSLTLLYRLWFLLCGRQYWGHLRRALFFLRLLFHSQ